MSGALTRGDLCQDMNFNDLQNGVRNISDAVNVGFANLNSTICNQQYDTARMIDSLGTTVLQGFNTMNISNLQSANAIQTQLATCCCNLERGQERIACQMATDTGAIISAGNANTQRILDYLCSEKISSLQAENALLTSQLSQNAQTRTLIDTLLPVAKPAYITCSPYASAFGFPYGYSNGSGCGCGTGFGF